MISDDEVLARLSAYHDHIDAPPFAVADDLRRGRRRVRRNRALAATGVTVTVACVAAVAWLVGGTRPLEHSRPAVTAPPATSPSATRSGWDGPLRPGVALPLVIVPLGEGGWPDPIDTTVAGVDLRLVRSGAAQRAEWELLPRQAPERSDQLDPERRIIEYGVVVDGDGDRLADCEIGLNNGPRPGEYRVWVTNLDTGVTEQQAGPPYGKLIDFRHPDESRDDTEPGSLPYMSFFFLFGSKPCDGFGTAAAFYAWSARIDDGRVVAWDLAPDAAWLPMRRP